MEKIDVSDPELQLWLKSASREDIEAALQVGWRNVKFMRSTRGYVMINTPIVDNTPVSKGQEGEAYVESILRERFADITNMTKVPKSGDITLWIGGRKIIVEIKKYTNPVPSSGVDKFRRDLSTTGATAGVFISLESPIVGITNDFKVQLELADGRTVPCAYIVSSDKSQIITSVNMVIHFASTIVNLTRDIYSRDNILGVVRDISSHVDELACMRTLMQRELADIAERAIKNSSNIMSTEVKLRGDIEKLQGELCETIVTAGSADQVNLSSITGYDKLSIPQKKLVADVMYIISEDQEFASTWKLTAKKCHHVQTGYALLFSAKKIQVSIPVSKINIAMIGKMITLLGSKYVYDGAHLIEISEETLQTIVSIVDGSFEQ